VSTRVSGARRAVARATAPLRMLPDFLVVGAKRAGTTTLYRYLAGHPGVQAARMFKGTHYFDVRHDEPFWWYRSCFPVRRWTHRLTGEASPYYMFHPLGPERIARALPNARLIVLLRNPIDRAYSHWRYEVRNDNEDLSFEAALDAEPLRLAGELERMADQPGYDSFAARHHSYLARSRYGHQLDRLYALVDPERVLVLQTERLAEDPAAEMQRAWDFLGLEPHSQAPLKLDAAPPGAPLADSLRSRVASMLESDLSLLMSLPRVDVHWPGLCRQQRAS
jgi:hypothetical protein